jgi:hypothetical protein
MNRFGENMKVHAKRGWFRNLIHWTTNIIVGKTILLFNKVHSQTKMGASQMYMACVFWIARTKQ